MNRIINQTELEEKINSTPTGPDRNALCDFSIMLQTMGKEIASPVFVPTLLTDEILNGLNDSDYYYVVTSGGYKECKKGFNIKRSPASIHSILIES